MCAVCTVFNLCPWKLISINFFFIHDYNFLTHIPSVFMYVIKITLLSSIRTLYLTAFVIVYIILVNFCLSSMWQHRQYIVIILLISVNSSSKSLIIIVKILEDNTVPQGVTFCCSSSSDCSMLTFTLKFMY